MLDINWWLDWLADVWLDQWTDGWMDGLADKGGAVCMDGCKIKQFAD